MTTMGELMSLGHRRRRRHVERRLMSPMSGDLFKDEKKSNVAPCEMQEVI
jgi:hypothetical protein